MLRAASCHKRERRGAAPSLDEASCSPRLVLQLHLAGLPSRAGSEKNRSSRSSQAVRAGCGRGRPLVEKEGKGRGKDAIRSARSSHLAEASRKRWVKKKKKEGEKRRAANLYCVYRPSAGYGEQHARLAKEKKEKRGKKKKKEEKVAAAVPFPFPATYLRTLHAKKGSRGPREKKKGGRGPLSSSSSFFRVWNLERR